MLIIILSNYQQNPLPLSFSSSSHKNLVLQILSHGLCIFLYKTDSILYVFYIIFLLSFLYQLTRLNSKVFPASHSPTRRTEFLLFFLLASIKRNTESETKSRTRKTFSFTLFLTGLQKYNNQFTYNSWENFRILPPPHNLFNFTHYFNKKEYLI